MKGRINHGEGCAPWITAVGRRELWLQPTVERPVAAPQPGSAGVADNQFAAGAGQQGGSHIEGQSRSRRSGELPLLPTCGVILGRELQDASSGCGEGSASEPPVYLSIGQPGGPGLGASE
jgi:hypothetical protein